MRGRLVLVAGLLVVAGCAAAPERTEPPEGVSAQLIQYRGKRLTRDVALAIHNDAERDVTVTSLRLTSNRWLGAVEWDGVEEIGPGFRTGIDVDAPTGTCPEGEDLAAQVDLTYTYGDDERRSTVPVEDPYGVLRDLVDGDCGAQAFAEATRLTVGEPVVTQDSWTAEVDLVPTGDESVVLLGFAPTLRFGFGPRTPTEVELDLTRPQRVPLQVVTGRCDPHVVAEDKVGTRFGVRVRTPELEHAYFTLELDEDVRQSLEDFYAARCRP